MLVCIYFDKTLLLNLLFPSFLSKKLWNRVLPLERRTMPCGGSSESRALATFSRLSAAGSTEANRKLQFHFKMRRDPARKRFARR